MAQDVEVQENTREGKQQSSFVNKITEKYIGITEKFCSAKITKVSAILEIQSTILHDSKPTFLQALGSYIGVLNNFEHMWDRLIPGGAPVDGVNDREQDVRRQGKDGEGEVIVGLDKQMWLQSAESDDSNMTTVPIWSEQPHYKYHSID